MRGRGHWWLSSCRQRVTTRCTALLLAGGVVAVSAAVTVSTPTTTSSAAVRLTGTTIGVGPSYDAFGLTVPLMFYGSVVPEGDSYHTVPYPAQISISLPVISDLPGLSGLPYWTQSLKRSEAIGAGHLLADIAETPAGEKVRIIGVSQGTQVAEIARTEMAKDPNYVANAENYEFILIGDPYQPNGGILTRLASWSEVPVLGDLFPFGRPGPADSPFKTTYYQNQYDGIADFPAYFSMPALLNSVAGQAFGHVFPGYVLEYPDAPNAVSTQVGNTTYVMLPQYLPLLAPLRVPASWIGAERFVDAMDPVLRVFVEMGYDRTADPSRVKEFSWITPPEKVVEALNELPEAFRQSAAILGGEPYTPTLPQPIVSDAEPDTPLPEHPAVPVGTSPFEQGLRKAMRDTAAALSNATRPLARVLQAMSPRTPPRRTVDPADSPAPADLEAGINAAAEVETQTEPKSKPLRKTRTRSESGPRLKAVRDAFGTRAEAASPAGESSHHADRTRARADKRATTRAAKSADAHRPSTRESAKAG
ncbi:PE-PPE domain-containing protein [Mycolicibacterium sp. HK-90]|uniref:PE-PPE domain-containing protein n=1 Tax=Mycolicibacterium sp. HK-90 TaxID=3056937 RepID=UPI002659A70A|nr:PE-PPE domain-containing protein [Mycolicibacterium sp. HK-90]WKG04599.1 PE-PPE domain-containing protein [Mycolicibacterium sp. HK-90]